MASGRIQNEVPNQFQNVCFKRREDDAVSNQTTICELRNVTEEDLQCAICFELYIRAVKLNCSHIFCSYCITKWKMEHNDDDTTKCPLCRVMIISEESSEVSNTAVEAIMQKQTKEMKQKRKKLAKKRKELELKLRKRKSIAWCII